MPRSVVTRTIEPLSPGDRDVIIGAGPAGLTAALLLARHDVHVIVLEADDIVGGIARTAEYKGFRFDIGGHRFFTKVPVVEELWRDLRGTSFALRTLLMHWWFHVYSAAGLAVGLAAPSRICRVR